MDAGTKTSYESWMAKQGVPVLTGNGFDVRQIELGPWPERGGRGAFVQLEGMEGVTGMEVVEIPPGKALEPEKHLYEKVIYVVEGLGSTEIMQEGKEKRFFEWGPGSLFGLPLNCWHRLENGRSEPALLAAVTNAPMIMDIFHSDDFIFNCDYRFKNRYDGEEEYFGVGKKRYTVGKWNYWDTNFIADVATAPLDAHEWKGSGGSYTGFEIAGNSMVGHLVEWPVGRYHKAHYHGAGAVLLILKSEGYSLMWPNQYGIHPFTDGHGEKIVKLDWRPGTVFSPPRGWFHQHFNLGSEKARQLALRYGSSKYIAAFHVAAQRQIGGAFISIKEGGTLIEYQDEDPEIRQQYEAALKERGVPFTMPPVKYSS